MLRRNSNWVVEGGAAVGGEAAKVLKAAHGAAANIRALALARLRMPSTCCYLACVWAGALMKPIWALERRSPQCARCAAEARDIDRGQGWVGVLGSVRYRVRKAAHLVLHPPALGRGRGWRGPEEVTQRVSRLEILQVRRPDRSGDAGRGAGGLGPWDAPGLRQGRGPWGRPLASALGRQRSEEAVDTAVSTQPPATRSSRLSSASGGDAPTMPPVDDGDLNAMEWAMLQAGSSSRGRGWAPSGGVSLWEHVSRPVPSPARSEERKS